MGGRATTKPRRRSNDNRIDELVTTVKQLKTDLDKNSKHTSEMRTWLVGDTDPVTGEPVNGVTGRLKKLDERVSKIEDDSAAARKNSEDAKTAFKRGLWGIAAGAGTLVIEGVVKLAIWIGSAPVQASQIHPH